MLKIIELFSGIGSQTQALKNLDIEHEVVAISEIDKYAVQSYEAMHGKANNLGDITKIQELPQADLWTYSFPCQDISVAGKGAGIKEGTRSGLLFEVERLLRVAEQSNSLPKYLLLENVKNLIGKKFRADFDSWLIFLSSLGYTNYWQVLNAKHYGIPQHRERVFCVSIRGEHTPFIFPEKQELTLRLRDMIDEIVDERYYLKESTIRSIMHSNFNQRRDSIRPCDGLANTLCSRDWRGPQCVKVGELVGDKWDKMHDISRRVYEPDGLSPTVHCAGRGNTEVKIVAMRGRNPENPSDRTAGAPTEQRLEPNSQGLCNTITTVQKDNLVMENAYVARRYGEFIEDKGISHAICAGDKQAVVTENVRIRKLTPRECLRLMGWNDEQIDKIQAAKVSGTQQYRQAGNGIVVQVLMAIFERLFLC